MKWFLWFLAVVSFVYACYSHDRWVGLLGLLIFSYFIYTKSYDAYVSLVGIAMLLFIQSLLITQSVMESPMVALVVMRRNTWMHLATIHGQYYVAIEATASVDQGDWLWVSGTLFPHRFNTYESIFNFQTYLDQRGMHATLQIESITYLLKNPLRIHAIRLQRLSQVPVDLQPIVSELLWNQQVNPTSPTLSVVTWLGLSGLGLMFTLKFLTSLIKLKLNGQQSTWVAIAIMFPWFWFQLHAVAIVRVVVLTTLDLVFSNRHRHVKWWVLGMMTLINPHHWLQLGGILYLLYQGLTVVILPLLPTKHPWQRWLQFSLFSMGAQSVIHHTINPIQSWLFLPISVAQVPLFLGWLFYFYTGLIPPLLIMITRAGFGLLAYLSSWQLTFHVGELSPFIAWAMLGLLCLWFMIKFLYLSRYRRYLGMTLAMLSLIHVTGIDGYVIPMVHFLNVGQGDATLIVSQGKSLLIDTGGQRHFDLASEVLIPYFKRIRIHQLNYVIITHPDFDHDGALPSLQQQWRIRTIIREPFMPFQVGVFRIENYQWDRHLYQDDNDASLIIGIQWHGCQALVMGDASVATEANLIQQFPHLKANILRIGHHGSNTSTSEALLMHVQPKVAIMSLGGDNRYGHPHPSVLERVSSAGIPIRRTDLEGTIRYQTCKI